MKRVKLYKSEKNIEVECQELREKWLTLIGLIRSGNIRSATISQVFEMIRRRQKEMQAEESPTRTAHWDASVTLDNGRLLKRCSHCKGFSSDKGRFCPHCGYSISSPKVY